MGTMEVRSRTGRDTRGRGCLEVLYTRCAQLATSPHQMTNRTYAHWLDLLPFRPVSGHADDSYFIFRCNGVGLSGQGLRLPRGDRVISSISMKVPFRMKLCASMRVSFPVSGLDFEFGYIYV